MPEKRVTVLVYKDLLNSVKAALTGGLLAAQKAVEYARLQTYWQIGKDVSE